jgi:hypothetical protein
MIAACHKFDLRATDLCVIRMISSTLVCEHPVTITMPFEVCSGREHPFFRRSPRALRPERMRRPLGSPCFNPIHSRVRRWPGSQSAFPATVPWPDVLWRLFPARPPPHRACDCTQERNDQENMSSYCRSSWRSASLATPETVPVNFPVAEKKTGLLRASANTGTTVSVNVRTPDASLKRAVPPVT